MTVAERLLSLRFFAGLFPEGEDFEDLLIWPFWFWPFPNWAEFLVFKGLSERRLFFLGTEFFFFFEEEGCSRFGPFLRRPYPL